MITPITRKELYLAKIIGEDVDIPETAKTREELFFLKIIDNFSKIPEPITREELFLAKIAGQDIELPKPKTRLELFLAKAAGVEIETPTPITREEIFWSNYSAIVDFEVEGIPPLTYKAKAGALKDYRIYGNTAGGESVGDKTENLFDEGLYDKNTAYVIVYVPVYVGNVNSVTCSTTCPMGTQEYKPRFIFILTGSVSSGAANNTNGVSINAPLTVTPTDGYVTIAYRQVADIKPWDYHTMLNTGSEPLPYEPYGYKVPVTVSNGTDTLTTPIYLPEPLKMVGSEAEYVDFEEQKLHRVGADDIDITLPELPTLEGTNVLTVGTEVQPSKLYIKGKKGRE